MKYEGLMLQPHHASIADAEAEFERTGRGYFHHNPVPDLKWEDTEDPKKCSGATHARLLAELRVPRRVELWPTPIGNDIWYRQFMSSESLRKILTTQQIIEAEPFIGELGTLKGVTIQERGAYDRWLLDFIDKLSDPVPPRLSTAARWMMVGGRQIGKSIWINKMMPFYMEVAEAMDRPRRRSTPPAKLSRVLTAIRSTMEEKCPK